MTFADIIIGLGIALLAGCALVVWLRKPGKPKPLPANRGYPADWSPQVVSTSHWTNKPADWSESILLAKRSLKATEDALTKREYRAAAKHAEEAAWQAHATADWAARQ